MNGQYARECEMCGEPMSGGQVKKSEKEREREREREKSSARYNR